MPGASTSGFRPIFKEKDGPHAEGAEDTEEQQGITEERIGRRVDWRRRRAVAESGEDCSTASFSSCENPFFRRFVDLALHQLVTMPAGSAPDPAFTNT